MRQKTAKVFCMALVLLTVAFIFYNSAQPVASSDEASENVAEQIVSVLPSAQDATQTPRGMRAFVQQVRKAAHAVEFFALGAELSVLFYLLHKKLRVQTLWNTVSSALAIAVADESIQILSGRGPKVQDVLLDFCGALAATALCWLLFGMIYAVRRRKKQKRGIYHGKIKADDHPRHETGDHPFVGGHQMRG